MGWKLWPALRKSLNSGATGGGSSAGATNAAPYSPYESPYGSSSQSPLSAGLSFGGGGGSGSTAGYGATNESLATALDNLLTDGINAADQLAENSDYQVSESGGDSLPLEPMQNFDVNQLATPLPTADGSADSTDYTTYDTNDYDAGQIDDSGGGGGGGDQYDPGASY